MTENSSIPADTFGDTDCAVVKIPNTVHGWRPISVMIHPAVFAMNGKAIKATIVRKNHLLVSSLLRKLR